MKLFLALVAFLAMVSAWWVYAGLPSSRAAGSQAVYLPLVTKEAWIDPVSIMQRDGHQAVFWPSFSAYYPPYYATPVPVFPAYLEVQNNAGRSVSQVKVEFQASDSSGAIITRTVTRAGTLNDTLKPGQRSPVALSIPFPGGYEAFQSATKVFTVLPDLSYNELASQEGLEVSWSYPGDPSATPTVPKLPRSIGWVKNMGAKAVYNVFVVVTVRGSQQASGLVLDATRASVYDPISPGNYSSFYFNFTRDYGALFGAIEAVAERRIDVPVILGASSW